MFTLFVLMEPASPSRIFRALLANISTSTWLWCWSSSNEDEYVRILHCCYDRTVVHWSETKHKL